MNRANLKIFSSAIAKVALDHQAALTVELAAAFAIINDCGESRRLARAMLCEVYALAGYHCKEPKDFDWKRVSRRVTAAIALYEFLNKTGEVVEWCEGKQRTELLNFLIEKIRPLKLKTTNEVLDVCDKLGQRRTRQPHQPGEPAHDAPGTLHVNTEHVHIVVPPETTRAELMEAAMALMRLAEQVAQTAQAETVAEVPHMDLEHAATT